MNEFEKLPSDETSYPPHEHEYRIELTRNEVLYLDDSFTLMIEKEIDTII